MSLSSARGSESGRWSEGKVFTQAFITMTLQPGEKKEFEVQWMQRDARGVQVLPGQYQLVVILPVLDGTLEGPSVLFTIDRGAQPLKALVASNRGMVNGGEVGEVLVNDIAVLRIRAGLAGLPPVARAEIVADRLRNFIAAGFQPGELSVKQLANEAAITWRGRLLITADVVHAHLNNTTPHGLASVWRKGTSRCAVVWSIERFAVGASAANQRMAGMCRAQEVGLNDCARTSLPSSVIHWAVGSAESTQATVSPSRDSARCGRLRPAAQRRRSALRGTRSPPRDGGRCHSPTSPRRC